MNDFMRSVRETRVPRGEAVLWWLGQMGLMIKTGGTVLCVDYCASPLPGRLYPPPVPAEEVEGVDVFFGTHDHADHIDHPAWRVWAKTCPGAVFVFPAAHTGAVLEDGVAPERCAGLDDMKECRVGDVTVRAVAAAHEFLSPDPVTGQVPCLQYIIDCGGVRIWHAGDTVRYEGMVPKLRSLGPFDAALLPINGRDGARLRRGCIGNMTFQEAVDAAGEVGPRLAIPGHWDLFADNPGDPAAFADYLDAKYPGQVKCVAPRRLAPVRVTGDGMAYDG